MVEVIEGLGPAERRRLAETTAAGKYVWVDADVTQPQEREAVSELVSGDEGALATLLDFDPQLRPSHRIHIGGDHVAFGMSCFTGAREAPVDVRVLVHGDFLLTLHEDDVRLATELDVNVPGDRGEQYLVYAVLDAIVATGYEALNREEIALGELASAATSMRDARIRMDTLRGISQRLSEMRRRLGPQRGRFDRISEEIGRVDGLEPDSEHYFERIRDQLDRLVDAVDAAGDAMAKIIDLKLNETMYRLTVVATVFLPLTFLVGFFGMNFGWMVERIDTETAFLLLGIVLPIAVVGAGWLLVRLRAQRSDDAAGG